MDVLKINHCVAFLFVTAENPFFSPFGHMFCCVAGRLNNLLILLFIMK